LINTYNQIKELLLEMNVECCPAIGAFPKHLMLGKVIETLEYPELRHQFYKSPIIPQDDANYQKVLSLLNRVREIFRQFNTNDKTGEVRITPSLDISVLSNKAIPFYYNITNPLLKYWNYFKSKRFMDKLNLSYHRDKLADIPTVRNPLEYNLDPFDFYRIEGHQGRPYKDALREINDLKLKHGLNFDVKALSIETNSSDFDMQKYKCQFEDLKALLNVWKAEQECILEQVIMFFSAFSTTAPGKNWISEEEGYDSFDRVVKAREAELLKEKEKIEGLKEEQQKEVQKQKDLLIQQILDQMKAKDDAVSKDLIDRIKDQGDTVTKEDFIDKVNNGDKVVVDGKDDIMSKENDVVKDDIIDRLNKDKEVEKDKVDKGFEYYKEKIGDDQMHRVDTVDKWTGDLTKADDNRYIDKQNDVIESAGDFKKVDENPDMVYKKYTEGFAAKDFSDEMKRSHYSSEESLKNAGSDMMKSAGEFKKADENLDMNYKKVYRRAFSNRILCWRPHVILCVSIRRIFEGCWKRYGNVVQEESRSFWHQRFECRRKSKIRSLQSRRISKQI
jgi:hypothetical protein